MTMKILVPFAAAVILFIFPFVTTLISAPQEIADTILHNGKILTVDKDFSIAQAIAIKNGIILAVGNESEVFRFSGPNTKTIDLKGKTVIPGLVDAHAHMDREGLKTVNISLAGVKSIGDILTIIANEVKKAKPGEWIVTMPIGDPPFFENVPGILREKRFPNRWDLDAVSPNNPVYIKGIWGYWDKPPITSVANSYALKLANITRDTVPPYPGIKIDKDPGTGEPTGIFIENSFVGSVEFTLMKVVPRFSYENRINALRDSLRAYLSVGTTSVYEGHGVAPEIIAVYKDLHSKGELLVRAYLVISPTPGKSASELEEAIRDWALYASGKGFGDSMLKIGGIFIEDPENNPHVARLRAQEAPYTAWAGFYYDAPSPEKVRAMVYLAVKYGLRVNTINVDSKSLDGILALFEEINKTYPLKERRWVVNHARTFNATQIERIKNLELIPEVIPAKSSIWKGGSARLKALPADRRGELAPYKSLLRAGLPVVFATDNSPYNPFITLWAAIARKDKDTLEVINPAEKLTREEALRCMTLHGAYVTFEEKVKGSLEKGKYADLAVLREDYLTIPEERIKDIEVIMTMVGGVIVYQKE